MSEAKSVLAAERVTPWTPNWAKFADVVVSEAKVVDVGSDDRRFRDKSSDETEGSVFDFFVSILSLEDPYSNLWSSSATTSSSLEAPRFRFEAGGVTSFGTGIIVGAASF